MAMKNWFFTLVTVAALVNYAGAIDVENLKLGCYTESPLNREFRVSPGDYQPWNLTPYVCLKLCGNMKYNLAALQNGNLCFCANTFNSSRAESSNCNVNCSGDKNYICGGTWENSVYNSSSYAEILVVNYFSHLAVFEWVNLTAEFVNRSDPGLRVAFDIGDENGDSPGESAEFKFKASYWGKITVKALPLHVNPKLDYTKLDVYIQAKPGRAELNCPTVVRTRETFHCTGKIYEGTNLAATWLFQDGTKRNISLPNPLYVRAGPAIPQWNVPGLISIYDPGLFLLPSSQFSSEARVLALEIYGHTAGQIKVFVVRPVCSLPAPYYCPVNLSCSHHQCSSQPTYHCSSSATFCPSRVCCFLSSSGNCSQSSNSTALHANNLRVTADLGVLSISTGYNLHVLPKIQTFDVQPGDMIAWGPAMDGKIAQKTGKSTVQYFPGLNVNNVVNGSEFSINQSIPISDLTYMVNIIGSQASSFQMNHQFNTSGDHWAQVSFWNTFGNDLPLITQHFLVQTPLINVKIAYPQGFSFYGTKINRNVEMTVNISTESNVTTTWTLLNSSSLLKRQTLRSLVHGHIVDKLNHTFPSLGKYFVLVEVANDVSAINCTVLVNVQDAISDLNASVVSTPIFLGAPTKMNASVVGNNVFLRWIFGDGSDTPFLSNATVVHQFSQTGTLNVSVIATNLASKLIAWFLVHVLHPLNISVPLQGAVDLMINSSCSLAGPFATDQYYYWDHGDGSTEEGLNKTQVTHTYTKGGTYRVSVKLQNEVLVNASSQIFIIEPVSGLTLDNFTGVELFDNHTFIARTVTGNNLTYEWYLHGNNTITIMICASNSIEFHFNQTGFYTISVNVSNSLSSAFTSLSFYVQLRIKGLGITAFPNPAPSNSTITFNITKGTGTKVKYRLDFGDGFVLQEFPNSYLFNRTFASGQWQVIFTGENAVNHVIVFYNVTVQDPVENVTIAVESEVEFDGRKIVPVGNETRFYSNVTAGTDVYFRWRFGDGGSSQTFKGVGTPSGETYHNVGHLFSRSGQFNISVEAFNAISLLRTWIIVRAQQGIEGFMLLATDRASPGEEISFRFSQTKGDNVSYVVDYGDGGPSQVLNSKVKSVLKSYNGTGVYNISVEAVNQISSQKVRKIITVQRTIQGLAFVSPIKVVETGQPSVISWRITQGSDVIFVVDYRDESALEVLDANVVGMNVTVRHNYSTWGEFKITITAYNLVGPNNTIKGHAVVDDRILDLVAYAQRSTIVMFENAVIVASISKGSRVTYEFDFADGSDPVRTTNNTVTHRYAKHGVFDVSVTASNTLTTDQVHLNETVTVNKPSTPLEIRGLNVSCQATTPGSASEIYISYEYGFLFQCEIDFGDETTETYSDTTLPSRLLHSYNSVGSFEVIVQCGNSRVKTTAKVDEVITGLKFKTGNGVIFKEFGQSVQIEWIWTAGTNVEHSVTLLGHGLITSQQTSQTGFVQLGSTLCKTPGNYTVKIALSNSVTPAQVLTAEVTFLQEISQLSISVNPITRTGCPVPVYVTVASGLDVVVLWKFGNGSDIRRKTKGFGSQNFIASHIYTKQGSYEVAVTASNENSVENVTDSITILDPVEGFSFHQNNTLIWPSRNIVFQFSRNSSLSDIFGAKYKFEFGNGETSKEFFINPNQTQFSYPYSYSHPGCYTAKLIIWNFVSRVDLTAPVDVIEQINNASLESVHSEYYAYPGTLGGGPAGDMFPLEYPVSFTITQDTGTCLKYDWNYGDYIELVDVTTPITMHAYPLPGTYTITANVSNSLGERSLHRSITLQHSVMGLYLAASGPARPGAYVYFVVFCKSLGTNSKFVFNAGNESYNVTLKRFNDNSKLKAESKIDPNRHLPFDPSSYYANVASHVYSNQGVFVANVWAWNNASQQSARTSVVITDKDVPALRVSVIGGLKSLVNSTALIYGSQVSLSSHVEIQREESYTVTFKWVVYKSDTYRNKENLPPESGREVSLSSEVLTDQSSLTVPAFGLGPGEYVFQLTVTIADIGINNADHTFIKIAGADIEARIAGGDLRSHDWGQRLVLDATESRDPLQLKQDDLNFVWFCEIIRLNPDIVKSDAGCFGNGGGHIEYTGKVFSIEPKSLYEATTYLFTVNVSSAESSRWAIATQTIVVLMGNPPDIRIRCLSNCGVYLKPSSRLVLSTECLNCDEIQPITYNWSAVDVPASLPFLVWPERTLTPQNFPDAVILGGTFDSGTSYRIKVVASRPSSATQGLVEYNIATNIPPKGGSCDVSPKTGEELDTVFTFSCSGWRDEHQPLTFEMFYSHPNISEEDPVSHVSGELFFFGPSLENHGTILPMGKKENNYFVNVAVIIRDAYGEEVDKTLRIQVNPRLVTPIELVNKTLAPGNEIEKAIGRGAVQEAVQRINAISDVLNEQNTTNDNMVEQNKRVRLAMIKYLAEFRPQSLNDILLGSKPLKAVTAVAAETDVEAQVLATKQYANMAAILMKESQGGEDGGVIETISTEILQGLSNVFVASSKSNTVSLNDEDKKAAEEVQLKILDLVDKVSDAMLHTMIPGQTPVATRSASVAIGLSKQEPRNMAGISVDVGGLGQFVIPRNVSLIDETKNYSYVTTTVTELSSNPFQSSNNSTLVRSNPLSLVLKGSDGNVIAVEGLTSPIDVLLPQKRSVQVSVNISQTPSSSGSMTFHKISIPNNDSVMIADILPSDRQSKLTIYLRYKEKPSTTEYDFKTTLPNHDSVKGKNYTLFVSRDEMKGKGEYYIGVLPSAHDLQEKQTVVNYTFDVICSACYFWNETTSEWSSRGCQVHSNTTPYLTHCQCSHLTWFGADLFIPPNKLDIESSLKKLPEIYKHPALLSTFCVIIGLYLVGLVWARRKDRRDITKVGLVPVIDNDPSDRYRYEVTVYTARGKNTGTTANVFILVAGEDGQSAVHVLKSTSRSCLHQGGVDSFLITTPECLGSLTFIRIWHDNTGKSPSWFLSQVVVRDIETEEKFFFLCNQWLACDEGDGQVDRLFPVAGKDELRDFIHLFKTKTSRDLSDGHLWFSIAFRPVRSRFTCVQRVSCCLSLLMSCMLANVLWYRTPVKDQNNVLIDLGFFEFTWHEILIGIQSSLIVFPINLLIVQLFRNRAVSPKTKQKYAERTRRESNFPTEKPRKQTAVSLSDITPTDSQRQSAGRRQKHVQLKNLTSIRTPVAVRKDSWDEDLFCSLLESQIGVLSESKEAKPKELKKPREKHNHVGEVPDFLSSDIYYYLYQDEARDQQRVCPESICSGDSADTTTALVKTEKPKRKKKRKMSCLFPWWFMYIGWLLCFSTAIIAGFFTLLYGLSFDNKQQEEWLVSMFVSMAQDILISQPLKVIIVAVLFALLLRKPQDEEDDFLNAELARDEEWLEQNLTHGQKRDDKATDAQYQRPPDKVLLYAARVRLVNERKMHSVIREIVFYLLFVWMVLLIAYGHRDPYAHFMTQNMENTFVGHQDSLGYRDEDKIISKKPEVADDVIKLYDVTNVNDFWEWIDQTLVPGLYNGAWYNGNTGQPGFLNDKMSFVVGVARIRQLRVKNGTCEVASVFDVNVDACDEPYSWDAEDQTPQYAPGWKPTDQNSSYTPGNSAWHYKTTTELKTRPFLGHLALYRGGGYKADLGSTMAGAYSMLENLKTNNWIDKHTRAVFIEFTVYNGHSNLYCVMNLLLEFTAAGGVVPFMQLLSTRIDRYVGNFLLFVLICEASFVIFTLVFTYREFKRLLKTDLKEYMTAFWTWIEIALLGLSWTSIVLYFIRFGLDKLTKKAFRENPREFVDFHHLALVDQLFGYVYAFVVFIISVKFLRLFRFNRRMSLLGSTLKCAAKEMLHFGIIFSLVFVGFSHLCYLVFSHELYKFHTFLTTVETLISVMLGKFSYVSLERTNRVLGPMMFFFYSIGVVFILINMFLSIIIENFKRVKRNNDLQSNEYEIVDFMTAQFMSWLGLTSRSIFKNRVFAEGDFKQPVYKKRKRTDEAAQLKERVDRLVNLIQKIHCDDNEEDFLRNDGEVTYLIPDIKLESYA